MDINKNFLSIEQMASVLNSQKSQNKTDNFDTYNGLSFSEILNSKSQENVKFSKHANERLEDRNIELSRSQMDRLNEATKLAKEKGINDSLIMVDNYAFIVNVKSNTVVTAVGENERNVFTNIDGAVIA